MATTLVTCFGTKSAKSRLIHFIFHPLRNFSFTPIPLFNLPKSHLYYHRNRLNTPCSLKTSLDDETPCIGSTPPGPHQSPFNGDSPRCWRHQLLASIQSSQPSRRRFQLITKASDNSQFWMDSGFDHTIRPSLICLPPTVDKVPLRRRQAPRR